MGWLSHVGCWYVIQALNPSDDAWSMVGSRAKTLREAKGRLRKFASKPENSGLKVRIVRRTEEVMR